MLWPITRSIERTWDFPGSPVVKSPSFYCRGCWFDTWWENWDPAAWCGQKKKSVISLSVYLHGLPWWVSGKEPACQGRRCRFNPWVGKILWRKKWQPTPLFLPGKSHGRRSLAGYMDSQSQTQLSDFTIYVWYSLRTVGRKVYIASWDDISSGLYIRKAHWENLD